MSLEGHESSSDKIFELVELGETNPITPWSEGVDMRTGSSERIRGIADVVLGDAARRGLHAGNRLPTERELSEGLRLTRSTVRSAMTLLEAEGVVSREVGRGTFLRLDPEGEAMKSKIPIMNSSATLKDVGPADVMAVRQLFEPTALYLVVTQATEEDFEEMERCLMGRAGSSDYDEFEKWDLAFHRCLVLASHNTLLIRMYLLIEVARQGELWGTLKRRADSIERRVHYSDQHLQIVNALRNRDGRGAYEAMTAHLDSVETYLEISARI